MTGLLDERGDAIMRKFSALRDSDVSSVEVHQTVCEWQHYISSLGDECTDEALAVLGEFYVMPDISKKIDAYGQGTAEFISRAIGSYCRENGLRSSEK